MLIACSEPHNASPPNADPSIATAAQAERLAAVAAGLAHLDPGMIQRIEQSITITQQTPISGSLGPVTGSVDGPDGEGLSNLVTEYRNLSRELVSLSASGSASESMSATGKRIEIIQDRILGWEARTVLDSALKLQVLIDFLYAAAGPREFENRAVRIASAEIDQMVRFCLQQR